MLLDVGVEEQRGEEAQREAALAVQVEELHSVRDLRRRHHDVCVGDVSACEAQREEERENAWSGRVLIMRKSLLKPWPTSRHPRSTRRLHER